MKPIHIVLIVIASLLLISILTYLFLIYRLFRKTLMRPIPRKRPSKHKNDEPNPYQELIDSRMKEYNTYDKEDVSIISFDGLKLNAHLIKNKDAKHIVILAHGYHSNSINEFIYSYNYYSLGYSLLLIDQRSHGTSEGKYIGMGVLERKDILDWIKFIKNRCGEDISILLTGVSMGSATVMMTSELIKDNSVKGIVADCGYTSITDEFLHVTNIPGKRFHIKVMNLMNRLFAKYDFNDATSINSLRNSQIPILIVHGSKDDFVPTKFAYELYEASSSKIKELFIVEGAKHAEAYRVDKEGYDKHVRDFLNKINF